MATMELTLRILASILAPVASHAKQLLIGKLALWQFAIAVVCGVVVAPTVAAEQERWIIAPQQVQLRGQRDTVHVMVSRRGPNGRNQNANAAVRFESTDSNVAKVDATGKIIAVNDGFTDIVVLPGETSAALAGASTASVEGDTTASAPIATIHVSVVDCHEVPVVDFGTEIQPILASFGCSAGACHGKQGGQNGFQLSLLGFDDNFDYGSITHHARGRRVFPAAPASSLLLRKAIADLPHGGGIRFQEDADAYQTLLTWIAQGCPRTGTHHAELTRIDVHPNELVLGMNDQHRLVVTASFSDGSRRDVTRWTAFSSNEAVIAQPDAGGVVTTGPIPGEAAVMARFLGQISTVSVLIPRAEQVDAEAYANLPQFNAIDDLVWRKLARLNLLPSASAGDAKFVRRIYLDVIGRLPTADETRSFLEDPDPEKHARLIDRLLEHPAYAEHWANKWVDLLRPNPYRVGIKAVMSFDNWIRQAFRENWPYDRFVRELLAAEGSTWRNGATTLFRDRRSPDELTTMVSQLFLGVRLECAKCHHHPFEIWGQDDFYSFAAHFAQVGRKGTGLSPPISGGEEIVFNQGTGSVSHPLTGETLEPRVLQPLETVAASEPLSTANEAGPDSVDRRTELVAWMTDDRNPYFSKVIANRVWADMMGRGLVEPVDDMRATNPASNEPLLDELARHLRESDYDLKELIRYIASSYVYRLSSEPNDTNQSDYRNYSRVYRQRLRAEVLLDSIDRITGAPSSFDGVIAGTSAKEIWTHRVPSLFLDTFGRPDPNQDPPCERASDTAVVQTLHLMNSPELHGKVTSDTGVAAALAASDRSPVEIINELYLSVFNRFPEESEIAFAEKWFAAKGRSRREATEDLMWAMLNSAEFVFRD